MDLYDSNVQKVMHYLKTENYSEGSISGHRVLYMLDDWNDRQNKYAPAYLKKLNDIYEIGEIKEEHRIGTRPVYRRLLTPFQKVITVFLKDCERGNLFDRTSAKY